MSKNILLIYESSRGSTEQAAEWIAEELPESTMINLKEQDLPEDMDQFDTIILGTGIVAGSPYSKIKNLLKKEKELLLSKELYLFITHLEEDEGIELDFQSAFPKEILEHATYRRGVGGRLDIKKVNLLVRPLMYMILKDRSIDMHNHDTLSRDACREFAEKVRNGG